MLKTGDKKMEVHEFEKKQAPRAKRSRLDPFLNQILELRKKGYAFWQICEFLQTNGITISVPGLRKFINTRADSDNNAVVDTQKRSDSTMGKSPAATPKANEKTSSGEKTIAEKTKEKLSNNPDTFVYNPSLDDKKLF